MNTVRHPLVTRHSSLVTALALAIAAVAANARASEPRLGACAHVTRDEWAERVRAFQMMREAGLDYVRPDFDWRVVQKEPGGPFDWSRYDRMVDDAAAQGIAVLPILCAPPRWARPVQEHIPEWRAFVREAISSSPNTSGFWAILAAATPATPPAPMSITLASSGIPCVAVAVLVE